MKNLMWVLLSVLMLLLGYSWGRYNNTISAISYDTDTIVLWDTIRDTVPFPKYITHLRHDTVPLPIVDTLNTIIRDSILVEVPIIQKEYVDTNYHAWVSGFRPSLDSIYVYPKTTVITNTTQISKRWGIGVQLGVGYGNRQVSPYIGVGISYNLWNF